MKLNMHFKSVAMRWFVEVFLIVLLVVTVLSVAISVFLRSLYVERVQTLAEEYAFEFRALEATNSDSFLDTAMQITNAFSHKDKMEVQILDADGKSIISTTGFEPKDSRPIEFKAALSAEDGLANFTGKAPSGESIVSQTQIVKNEYGTVIGGYRWIVSLAETYKRFRITVALIAALALVVLGLCAVSGIFFIGSILKPVREISSAARKIALGDFKTRIENERGDEIAELCDSINEMASELQHAEEIKNDFISSVSHELRTPLTAIRGWGETAKMSIGTDEELVSRGIDVVLSEADRLSGLVEELLDFSRMQSGRLTVNTQPIDVSMLLKSTYDMYTELASKQGIEISYTPPIQNSIVMGDPDRLKQVFINVIDNAVKYTEKGGLILVVQTREEGCVQIVIKDTGVGIPAEDVDHVKEKFFKSNKTVRGSGIGLAVADEIIKQHGGLLFVESTEGVGTTVTIVLPLYEPKEEAQEENQIETKEGES
ncbi:MAG: HAMP domain-containing histidine kinase [Clostridia bacterium]|nr:HAMP domain-containing histidine kinase [Clostridia bacterium]